MNDKLNKKACKKKSHDWSNFNIHSSLLRSMVIVLVEMKENEERRNGRKAMNFFNKKKNPKPIVRKINI